MSEELSLEQLEAQHKDISKRLKTKLKEQDERRRIIGAAILEYVSREPDSGITKQLVEFLNRTVTHEQDREKLDLAGMLKKIGKAADTGSLSGIRTAQTM